MVDVLYDLGEILMNSVLDLLIFYLFHCFWWIEATHSHSLTALGHFFHSDRLRARYHTEAFLEALAASVWCQDSCLRQYRDPAW